MEDMGGVGKAYRSLWITYGDYHGDSEIDSILGMCYNGMHFATYQGDRKFRDL
jgi:hypothetical protein